MAISIVEALRGSDRIDPDQLADLFGGRYNPSRGYGGAAHGLLQAFRAGADWKKESPALFSGSGSYGNGSAMRVAPLGAYFADSLDEAAGNARQSAIVTHAHPEGTAGAVAVACAAALAYRHGAGDRLSMDDFIGAILERVPESETRQGIATARSLPIGTDSRQAAVVLGSGQRISAQDTVPYVIWCASRYLDNFEEAFWNTVAGLGDRDTTCAMVGGITALSDREKGIPEEWLERREKLPLDFLNR
jgi:ADP-ribosylglycohydrolase